jgi:hypothetical protein
VPHEDGAPLKQHVVSTSESLPKTSWPEGLVDIGAWPEGLVEIPNWPEGLVEVDFSWPERLSELAQPGESLLAPVINFLSDAIVRDSSSKDAVIVVALRRVPLIQGLAVFARVLESFGLSDHMQNNVDKLQRARTSNDEDYETWLLSELPTHASTGFTEFVDDSAWMANLWTGRMLDFFVEMCRGLLAGSETRPAIHAAYQKTVGEHHNWFQRQHFALSVMATLPVRRDFLHILGGGACIAKVHDDLGAFVNVASPLARFCFRLNDLVCSRMEKERKLTFGV